MKILLMYSRFHFDPEADASLNPHSHSSTAILARMWYGILKEWGTVDYLDQHEYEKAAGKEYDLLVGIGDHFKDVLRIATIRKSLFFAVNMHPSERNRILLGFAAREMLALGSLKRGDLSLNSSQKSGIALADGIICVGNSVTRDSFTRYGVPRNKIRVLNYGLPHVPENSVKTATGTVRKFLYMATEIGLRKGFDVLAGIFSHPEILSRDFELHIIGSVPNPVYRRKLDHLTKLLGKKIIMHGWIDANKPEYAALVAQMDCLVFPSLEEGQAGTVLDCVARGVVPILSAHSGLDFSPLGYLELKSGSRKNRQIIHQAMDMEPAVLLDWSSKTVRYYREFHHDFEETFRKAFRQFMAGHLYPKFSAVLAIFNKERTILPLIGRLDKALKAYPDSELIVIFDGCKDRTETRVRKFFRQARPYPVHFEVTPDIFEVKTNNLGMRTATGEICAIIQDDNYLLERGMFFEAADHFERSPKTAVVGGLSGVNFYPLDYRGLRGPGQVMVNPYEVYWRQDDKSDPSNVGKIYQVDACMRGPLFIRKDYLEKHGYLDEAFAPLYNDDMDLCFRARRDGYLVYAIMLHARNQSLTMAKPDTDKKSEFYENIFRSHAELFYSRWKPTIEKPHTWIWRNHSQKTAASVLSEWILDCTFFILRLRMFNPVRFIRRRLTRLFPAGKKP